MTKCMSHQPRPARSAMRSGVVPVCVRLCRTPQNRRDTTADGLKNQPPSHHWQLLGQPDCCCRARQSPPAPRFPHRLHPAPRGLLLGRFFNAGRHRPSRHRHAAARIEKPSPCWPLPIAARKDRFWRSLLLPGSRSNGKTSTPFSTFDCGLPDRQKARVYAVEAISSVAICTALCLQIDRFADTKLCSETMFGLSHEQSLKRSRPSGRSRPKAEARAPDQFTTMTLTGPSGTYFPSRNRTFGPTNAHDPFQSFSAHLMNDCCAPNVSHYCGLLHSPKAAHCRDYAGVARRGYCSFVAPSACCFNARSASCRQRRRALPRRPQAAWTFLRSCRDPSHQSRPKAPALPAYRRQWRDR